MIYHYIIYVIEFRHLTVLYILQSPSGFQVTRRRRRASLGRDSAGDSDHSDTALDAVGPTPVRCRTRRCCRWAGARPARGPGEGHRARLGRGDSARPTRHGKGCVPDAAHQARMGPPGPTRATRPATRSAPPPPSRLPVSPSVTPPCSSSQGPCQAKPGPTESCSRARPPHGSTTCQGSWHVPRACQCLLGGTCARDRRGKQRRLHYRPQP
jgi:hypothetical protein